LQLGEVSLISYVSYEAPAKLLHFISSVYSPTLSRDNYINLGVLTEFIKRSNWNV